MEMEITDTIRDVTEKEWTALVGSDFLERSHAWYRTVEDSCMRRMCYIFVRENNTLVAGACCFPYTERRYIELPFLEVRSPLGTSLALFSQTSEHVDMLLEGLQQIQKKEKAKGLLILDLKRKEFISLKNQVRKFTEFQISDNTYLNLNFTDFDDYLDSLKEDAWRSARMTLNRAKRWKIKTVITDEISTWKEPARRLQQYTCEEHQDSRFFLPEQFYDALEKNMKENVEVLLFMKDDTTIVFALSLNTPETAIYKFMGLDPAYKKYQAYFLIYYEGIRRAIEKKQKRIYFGPTTYEFKEKIGCKREELFGLVRMVNPVMDVALKSYIAANRLKGKKF
ncbi:MAG: GNAT family N-acetyltransferase [Theionarchaea archaeon]|nr:GNAT family N-acetyltransferase [Theionarchaea archaeon]